MTRHVHIKELDLSASGLGLGFRDGQEGVAEWERMGTWSTGGSGFSIQESLNTVPGFRTSAAFFSFLRANLVLPPSTLNSTTSTPLLDPSSSQTLPPLQPSSLASMSSNDHDHDHDTDPSSPPTPPLAPFDDIPPLVTTTLTTVPDKTLALKLIADSIAQQRQLAARSLILHPLNLAVYFLFLAVLFRILYHTPNDIGLLITTSAGATMAWLVAVRGLTSGYIQHAEELNWSFIEPSPDAGSTEEDTVIGSRFGEEVIGALVLRLERSGGGTASGNNGHGSGRRKGKGKTGGKGIVRAWTTRVKYRGKGVGTELLEEAVRVTKEKLGGAAEVGFAREHANSMVCLWEMFNGPFRRGEGRAARALDVVVGGWEARRRR